ncbi:MAG TPA: hypothetical protein VHD63_14290 [Ktedonobacteraceae bacterium]|nr:hypothetical protein [Ktedonobacteraceae bacterium]
MTMVILSAITPINNKPLYVKTIVHSPSTSHIAPGFSRSREQYPLFFQRQLICPVFLVSIYPPVCVCHVSQFASHLFNRMTSRFVTHLEKFIGVPGFLSRRPRCA